MVRELMIPQITSLQNPRIKQALRLRESRGRKLQQRTLVDGYRELSLAVAAGISVVDCYVTADCERLPEIRRQPGLAEHCIQVPLR